MTNTLIKSMNCSKFLRLILFIFVSEMPIGDHNYCRQPEIDGERAWCYTMDPDERWEYCDVPECHEGINSQPAFNKN